MYVYIYIMHMHMLLWLLSLIMCKTVVAAFAVILPALIIGIIMTTPAPISAAFGHCDYACYCYFTPRIPPKQDYHEPATV